MPGLSFICDVDHGVEAMVPRALCALDAVRHDGNYGRAVLLHEQSCFLAISAYRQYPVASFDFGDVVVHLEGRLYGPLPAEQALRRLARTLFEPGESDQQVAEWVREMDGEFVVIAGQRSTGRIAILNDLLGRLPLYCRRTAGTLFLSRELRFIAQLLPKIRFDRMGMAQFLLLGFPLGSRTLLEGVERVAAATCIRIDARNKEIHQARAPALDIGRKNQNTRVEARDLATLFVAGCRTRAASNGENVVSLSGGADSRSVAAGLRCAEIPFRCATFLDAGGVATADVEVAERLAKLLGSAWHLFRLRPPSSADHLSLLRRKGGLNPLSMSYLLPYLEQVQRHLGDGIVFFTGDGGDKLLPDLRAAGCAVDADGTAAQLLRTRQIFSLEEVSAFTGVSRVDIFVELRDRLHSYPEEGWADRRVHFEIFERAFKWLFEGEDRNRGFFWSTTPFYATPFFLASMRCGDGHKAHRALYRNFLLEISPPAAAIEYAGVGAPIDSAAFRVATKAASLLAEHLNLHPGEIPPCTGRTGARGAAAVDHLRRQVARCAAVAEYLCPDRLAAFLDGPAGHLPWAADTLFTLTSLIEDVVAGRGSVDASPHDRSGGEAIAGMSGSAYLKRSRS